MPATSREGTQHSIVKSIYILSFLVFFFWKSTELHALRTINYIYINLIVSKIQERNGSYKSIAMHLDLYAITKPWETLGREERLKEEKNQDSFWETVPCWYHRDVAFTELQQYDCVKKICNGQTNVDGRIFSSSAAKWRAAVSGCCWGTEKFVFSRKKTHCGLSIPNWLFLSTNVYIKKKNTKETQEDTVYTLCT